MRTMTASVVVSVLLGGFTVAAAQLPPEIMADSYLLQAEQLIAEQNYGGALDALNEIVALQREHNFTLPDVFHFRCAKAATSVELPEQALEAVLKYPAATGREGGHYVEALELMNKAQTEVEELKARRKQAREQKIQAALAASGTQLCAYTYESGDCGHNLGNKVYVKNRRTDKRVRATGGRLRKRAK